jgi:hypothetical protein
MTAKKKLRAILALEIVQPTTHSGHVYWLDWRVKSMLLKELMIYHLICDPKHTLSKSLPFSFPQVIFSQSSAAHQTS